jgi:hypothetical protein
MSMEYWGRLANARRAPKANEHTRVALVAFERGISQEELEQFYYVNRKGGTKRHFDYLAFAKKYDVSKSWIFDGFLPEHPRDLKRQPQRRTNS